VGGGGSTTVLSLGAVTGTTDIDTPGATRVGSGSGIGSETCWLTTESGSTNPASGLGVSIAI
jgi:hypothetical protein